MKFLIDLGETEERFDWLQTKEIKVEDLNEVRWALRRAIWGSFLGGFSIYSSLSWYRWKGGFKHYERDKVGSMIVSITLPIVGLTSSVVIFAAGLYFFFKTTDRMYFKYKQLEEFQSEGISNNQPITDTAAIES
ncbi:unnamed protein product [Blepharisma stoltei]|uniref:Transmembrane protein n=1 Tax=Blepharisma stoltei TaxID=1481888 RepID=A0AAU9JUK4_9CILI|nr:unnamed protein product [Blepharisma stoltei]